jgi:ankyrin repeat protein
VLKTNPEVLNERDIYGFTLLGTAVLKRSLEFIKLLAETDEGLEYYAREKDDDEGLPIHYACYWCNVEVAKYLLSIYPESINIPGDEGYFPLHCAIWNNEATDDDLENLIRFLLLHDQGAVSKHTNLGLPLHLACWRQQTLDVVKLVYNKYPQGIHLTRNKDGKTLLNCCKNGDIRIFFRSTQVGKASP